MAHEVTTTAGTVSVEFVGYAPPAADGKSYVIDGDTIVVGGQRWRLAWFDAPAIAADGHGRPHCAVERDLGVRAKSRLEQLIHQGSTDGTLSVKIWAKHLDRYHRHLVSLYVGGVDVRLTLINEGLAKDYGGRGPKPVFCNCADLIATHEHEIVWAKERKQQR